MAEIEQIDCGRGRENNEIQRVETESEMMMMMMMVYGDWMILNIGHVWIWASLHYYYYSCFYQTEYLHFFVYQMIPPCS
jgi:hypothetical protein